jgi:hypothetical protein
VVNFAPRRRFGFLVGATDLLAAVPGECGRFLPVERHRLLLATEHENGRHGHFSLARLQFELNRAAG